MESRHYFGGRTDRVVFLSPLSYHSIPQGHNLRATSGSH